MSWNHLIRQIALYILLFFFFFFFFSFFLPFLFYPFCSNTSIPCNPDFEFSFSFMQFHKIFLEEKETASVSPQISFFSILFYDTSFPSTTTDYYTSLDYRNYFHNFHNLRCSHHHHHFLNHDSDHRH